MSWGEPLAHDLELADGRVVRTLHDARALFTSSASSGVTGAVPLEYAIELLLKAAESGQPDDIEAATDQIETALRMHGMA